jgi:hypothetical protein
VGCGVITPDEILIEQCLKVVLTQLREKKMFPKLQKEIERALAELDRN